MSPLSPSTCPQCCGGHQLEQKDNTISARFTWAGPSWSPPEEQSQCEHCALTFGDKKMGRNKENKEFVHFCCCYLLLLPSQREGNFLLQGIQPVQERRCLLEQKWEWDVFTRAAGTHIKLVKLGASAAPPWSWRRGIAHLEAFRASLDVLGRIKNPREGRKCSQNWRMLRRQG